MNIPKKSKPLDYKPEILSKRNQDHLLKINAVLSAPHTRIIDTFEDQVKEFIKLRSPSKQFSDEELTLETQLYIKNNIDAGNWVYYPWNGYMVHLLEESEFIEVRTNRNRNKITQEEQQQLGNKTIGVIGLSVGHSIALTLATERICKTIRLADFDTLELSNLNRIRTGVHNLGMPKVIFAAREIAEIDPYLNIEIFPEGVTEDNINSFFINNNNKLDILVEVCDGLDIKIESRLKARELKIPVVMDTNDRGMMDIERFDLEPDRQILHGLTGEVDLTQVKNLTNEEKVPFVLAIIGAETMSDRLKSSMKEIKKTISTWPQLASSVVLGAALCTDVCRRILLDQFHESGRYYVDIDQQISDKRSGITE
jgi:molybdopterin/thiamine biosynthesis adenylyltransferase